MTAIVAELFGENLRRLRKREGISQEELALRASLHRTEIGQLEHGARLARIDTLIKLAGALSVPPADLLAGITLEPGRSWPNGRFELSPQSAPPSRRAID
jgi:transcriptional regulator with XRE-family HTH domain